MHLNTIMQNIDCWCCLHYNAVMPLTSAFLPSHGTISFTSAVILAFCYHPHASKIIILHLFSDHWINLHDINSMYTWVGKKATFPEAWISRKPLTFRYQLNQYELIFCFQWSRNWEIIQGQGQTWIIIQARNLIYVSLHSHIKDICLLQQKTYQCFVENVFLFTVFTLYLFFFVFSKKQKKQKNKTETKTNKE